MKIACATGSFLLVLVALESEAAAQTGVRPTDPAVAEMVESVSKERLTAHVQTLQDFQTRHTYTDENTAAGDWLFDTFASYGLEVERHSFTFGQHTEDNIIARLPGLTRPDEIVVVSGHFDSTSNMPLVLAPGADDDASAIAGVLEAAWIFREHRFERTIEFMCFNAEEQGRRGSAAIADDYLAAGKDIVAVVNSDMIGYWPTGWDRDLDVAYEPVSSWLADHVISVTERYVGIPVSKKLSKNCKDDHYAFTTRGIAAISNMDCWEAHNNGGETTPHYHKTTDTIDTLNLDCMTQVVQVNVASVAELARPMQETFFPFCAATPNSTGQPARITAQGCASLAADDFRLRAEPVPNQLFLFFLGPEPTQVPFGNGFRCVDGRITRLLPPGVAADNLAEREVDLAAFGITVPETYYFQCWYRDSFAGGAGFDTSNGLSVTFTP